MESREGTSGVLIGAAVCTLFLVAHGTAQDSLSVSCLLARYLPFADLVRCAEQGVAAAQYHLGIITTDEAEAVRLYRLAAEQGLAGAQVTLGRMNANGSGGVPLDYVSVGPVHVSVGPVYVSIQSGRCERRC